MHLCIPITYTLAFIHSLIGQTDIQTYSLFHYYTWAMGLEDILAPPTRLTPLEGERAESTDSMHVVRPDLSPPPDPHACLCSPNRDFPLTLLPYGGEDIYRHERH